VRANADLATQAMIHGHERDGRSWKSEWVLLPEACLYTGVSVAAAVSILEGLEVDAGQMLNNLNAQRGYPMSEPVMRALADRVGKHTAHRIVFDTALAGREADIDFRSALRADDRLADLSDEEIDRLLDPRNALGSIPRFIDSVLAPNHG
jgi:adenylosuccinate lyase